MTKNITVGVLALQGGVIEHINLLRKAASHISSSSSQKASPPSTNGTPEFTFDFSEVRTAEQLTHCDALIIPGGESTTMAIVARRLGLLDPLREFVKVQHKPVWGTCAGLVILAEQASATKQGGQELVGGLDVRVLRNRYGTQMQSFVAGLDLPFLGTGEEPFRAVFIRAPIVEGVISEAQGTKEGKVEVLGVYPQDGEGKGDIVAVRQGNVFGTSFHPELTDDVRIHVWWLKEVVDAVRHGKLVVNGA